MDSYQNPNMNQQPSSQMPRKSGHGGLVAVIVIILVILAAILFWPEQAGQEPIPEAPEEQAEDFSSLEAELEATDVDGVSDGL